MRPRRLDARRRGAEALAVGILVATTALTLISTPASSLRGAPHSASVRAPGSGHLMLAHRFPLDDLIYTADPSGRWTLTLMAGKGVVVLSGSDADELTPAVYRLHLDVMQISTKRAVTGTCELQLSTDAKVYRELDYTGRVTSTGEEFRILWHGSGAPAHFVP